MEHIATTLWFGISLAFYWGLITFLLHRFHLKQSIRARWSHFGAADLKERQRTPGIRIHKLMHSERLFYAHIKKIEHFLYRGGLNTNSIVHILIMPMLLISLYLVFIVFLNTGLKMKILCPPLVTGLIYLAIVAMREKFWKKKFVETFPNALDIIGRGLKSGLTLVHGIELAAKEMEGPVQGVFKIIVTQLRLGIPLDKALYELAIKIDLEDFRIFALGLALQKETGGGLLDILEKLALLIRDRDHFDRKLKALSAEGKTTAKIMGVIPFLVWAVASFTSPGYFNFFIYTSHGHLILAVSMLLSLAGFVVINRMSSLGV